MGHKKQETKQAQNTSYNNANTYGWETPKDTPDIEAYRNWKPQVDPGLGYQYANARGKLESSFNDPLGGYSTPQMKDAQLRTGLRNLNQDESQAFRQGTYDVNNQTGGKMAALAALTRPNLVQTGSSGTGTGSGTSTTTQSGGLLGDVLIGAAGGGASALGGKNRRT